MREHLAAEAVYQCGIVGFAARLSAEVRADAEEYDGDLHVLHPDTSFPGPRTERQIVMWRVFARDRGRSCKTRCAGSRLR